MINTIRVTVKTSAPHVTYNGPGSQFNQVSELPPGASAIANGRSPDNAWLKIIRSDGQSLGWIDVGAVAIEGDLHSLAVVDAPQTADPSVISQSNANITSKRASVNVPTGTPTTPPPPQSLEVGAPFIVNDRPIGQDRLNFEDYANAFAALLRNPATQPPLAIGLYAAWGMGKSFLMRLIRRALEKDPPADTPQFIFVDFNAWVYSGSDNLWAGLISRIYERVEKALGDDYQKFREGRDRAQQRQQLSLRVLLYIIPALAFAGLAALGQIAQLWNDVLSGAMGLSSIIIFTAGLVRELKNVFEFVGQRYTERAQQFRQAAARPDFRSKIGFMSDVKAEIDFVLDLLESRNPHKPVRLVIFIDDLDRCPPHKAVEVLEAIMLLLSDDRGDWGQKSFAPFFIFLGLDARVLVKAIEDRYGKVLTDAGISGYEYLDKIVQIPFTIPASSDDALRNYLYTLMPRNDADVDLIQKTLEEIRAERLAAVAAAAGGQPAGARAAGAPSTPGTQPPAPTINEVSFTKEELRALDEFAPYLSHNPRRAKRIVNVYRLVRLIDSAGGHGLSGDRSRKLIKWVVLNEQWPYRMGLIIGQCQNAAQIGEGVGSDAGHTLAMLYEAIQPRLAGEDGSRLLHLDDDPEVFVNFITRDSTSIAAADIHAFEPITFNLNPAIGGEVRNMLAKTVNQ